VGFIEAYWKPVGNLLARVLSIHKLHFTLDSMTTIMMIGWWKKPPLIPFQGQFT